MTRSPARRFPLLTVPLFVALAAVQSVRGAWTPEEMLPRWRPSPVLDSLADAADRLLVDPCEPGPIGAPADPSCASKRHVFVDYSALGVDRPGGEWITYDFEEVTRPVLPHDLPRESELSLAVRLIISEVGADRLLANATGFDEAVGILYTVDNRLDPLVYNPENRPEAPVFPGCGPEGTWGTCANPEQYLGMATWRALDPSSRYPAELLAAAVDKAVVAWFLQDKRLVPDITGGATNYVHRCGGAAYGEPTWRCDGHLGRPDRDIPGGEPFTGPIVFKAPTTFLERFGFYGLYESMRLDYRVSSDAIDVLGADGDAIADAAE